MPAWLAIAIAALSLYLLACAEKLRRRSERKRAALHRSQIGEKPRRYRPPQIRRMTDEELAGKLASIERKRREYFASLPEEKRAELLSYAENPRRGRPMNGNAD